MAESVDLELDKMVGEFTDFSARNLFNPIEIQSIVKKRRDFEYALQKRIVEKSDFLRYIQYEMSLDSLRSKRKTRLCKEQHGIADSSIKKRIKSLFERATTKFKGDVNLWTEYLAFSVKENPKIAGKGNLFYFLN